MILSEEETKTDYFMVGGRLTKIKGRAPEQVFGSGVEGVLVT